MSSPTASWHEPLRRAAWTVLTWPSFGITAAQHAALPALGANEQHGG